MRLKSVIPRRVEADEAEQSNTFGRFTAEPLERGYGTTLGNSLRRVLLSSIPGSAITTVKIEGVLQEVSSVPGVYEDVTDIVLNLKEIVVKLNKQGPVQLYLNKSGPGEVTAADIEDNSEVEILNPEHHIATLEKEGSLSMEITVDQGRGYVPAERLENEDLPIHTIAMDAVFTPIRRVKYRVENTRVEEITDYDKLILEIWTNGTVSPEDALSQAAKTLRDHVSVFVTMDEDEAQAEDDSEESEIPVNPNLLKTVDELELSVRSYNCLKAANIASVAELVQRSESEMLKYRNFGKKSLTEIRELLTKMGLDLGMDPEEHPQLKATLERINQEKSKASTAGAGVGSAQGEE